MKGQSQFVGYVLTAFFGILIIGSILSLSYMLQRISIQNEIREELKQLAVHVSGEIIKLYDGLKNSEVVPQNNSIILLGKLNLKLPSKVAGKNYELALISSSAIWITITNSSSVVQPSNAKVLARTTQEPLVEIEEVIPNIDIDLQGAIRNGENGYLLYYRYNKNNIIQDVIILGNQDIIINIESVE